MEFIINGSGGNGQTFFIKHLVNIGVSTNNVVDSDGFKHCNPNKIINLIKSQNIKVIYVYNDPFNSICSLYRRGYQQAQINKMRVVNNILPENIDEYFKLVENTNKDYFGYYEHINEWYSIRNDISIYFHNFIDPNWEELSNFLSLDENDVVYQIKNRDNLDFIEKYPKAHLFYDDLFKKIQNLVNDNL